MNGSATSVGISRNFLVGNVSGRNKQEEVASNKFRKMVKKLRDIKSDIFACIFNVEKFPGSNDWVIDI